MDRMESHKVFAQNRIYLTYVLRLLSICRLGHVPSIPSCAIASSTAPSVYFTPHRRNIRIPSKSSSKILTINSLCTKGNP